MMCSKWFGPPLPRAHRVVKISPLSVSVDAGNPWIYDVVRNVWVTIGAVTALWQLM